MCNKDTPHLDQNMKLWNELCAHILQHIFTTKNKVNGNSTCYSPSGATLRAHTQDAGWVDKQILKCIEVNKDIGFCCTISLHSCCVIKLNLEWTINNKLCRVNLKDCDTSFT